MGTFRIEIQAVGGHGCDRDRKDGELVKGCGLPNCPDCQARAFVQQLKNAGSFGYSDCYARLLHWPGHASEVVDDLLTGKRKGNF
jgi:hypothetical protein